MRSLDESPVYLVPEGQPPVMLSTFAGPENLPNGKPFPSRTRRRLQVLSGEGYAQLTEEQVELFREWLNEEKAVEQAAGEPPESTTATTTAEPGKVVAIEVISGSHKSTHEYTEGEEFDFDGWFGFRVVRIGPEEPADSSPFGPVQMWGHIT